MIQNKSYIYISVKHNDEMKPAEMLKAAIKAEKLAEDNFRNYELYEVLKHRACVLKLSHAKLLGSAAEKIITEKYGKWIFDSRLRAKALHFAIMEKYGIDADVVVMPEGVSLAVNHIYSASTLLKAFIRFRAIVRTDAADLFTIFVPANDDLLMVSE